MPTGLTTTLIAFGAVLTSVDATAGAIVAGIGAAWQVVILAFAGDAS